MTDIRITFGETIRRLREERTECSQERFADIIGVHRTYISMIERGTTNVTLEVITQIAGALGLSLPELFTEVASERKHRSVLQSE